MEIPYQTDSTGKAILTQYGDSISNGFHWKSYIDKLKVQCTICIHTGIYLGQIPELNPVDSCQGFPTELTPRG